MFSRTRPVNPAHLYHTDMLTPSQLFADGEVGFLVPHFYPEYTWSTDDVCKFLSDICRCVSKFVDDLSIAHYFGPITLSPMISSNYTVSWLDPYATPRRIYTVIDGQQRLVALSLLACQIYQRLFDLRPLTYSDSLSSLRYSIDYHMDALIKIFAFNLQIGLPSYKPSIIHGRWDRWQREEVEFEYRSGFGRYIGQYLLALVRDKTVPQVEAGSSIETSVAEINRWLDSIVNVDYIPDEMYPTAWQIRSGLHSIDRPFFNHPEITSAAASGGKIFEVTTSKLCSLMKLIALSYVVLHRCCFAVITPTTEQAGVDLLETRGYKLFV